MEYLPNRLTSLYSKIYYKEENYLKVRTELLIYLSPPYSKGLGTWECWYIGIYIPMFLCIYILNSVIWLSYPLSYSFTGLISPMSYILIFNQYKSIGNFLGVFLLIKFLCSISLASLLCCGVDIKSNLYRYIIYSYCLYIFCLIEL